MISLDGKEILLLMMEANSPQERKNTMNTLPLKLMEILLNGLDSLSFEY